MLNTNESVLRENNSIPQNTLYPRNSFFTSIHELPQETLYQAMVSSHPQDDPLEELIATGNAAFTLLREMEIEKDIRDAFYRLEKQFTLYALLLGKG